MVASTNVLLTELSSATAGTVTISLATGSATGTRRGMPARSRQALDFLVRQGDNGIVWNILSYWRATK